MPPDTVPEKGEVEKLVAERVRDFASAILHGDETHREWLLEAADAFVDGGPLPPPRDKKADLIRDLKSERDALSERLAEAEQLLSRYRKETPLGHQPHMIAHEADAFLNKEKNDAAD